MKRILICMIILALFAGEALAQGDLEKSKKKTLFIFPIQYGSRTKAATPKRKQWIKKEFYKTFVTGFERFDFIEMNPDADLDAFLNDAKTYMEEHAREMVQKRKEKDGRIGEVRVTLEDLKVAVEDGYVFVPKFDKLLREKDKKDNIDFKVNAHIDIYRTSNGADLGEARGSTLSVGALLGVMRSIAQMPDAGKKEERQFRSNVLGVFEEMKTNIRKMEEFSLKAQVTSSSFNSFRFDLGMDFGVKLDKRYMVWELDREGKRTDMLAFGKVRKIEQNESKAQILIGTAPRGSQVVEAAKFGLNISPQIGMIPFETKGFDQFGDGFILRAQYSGVGWIWALPEDGKGYKPSLGLNVEYNMAWILGASELYTVIDGAWIPMANLNLFNAMIGIEKKLYFRRLALFGTLKYGVFGANFVEVEFFDEPGVGEADDARIWGIGADLGGEILLSPNMGLQARLGWVGFPEQTVLGAFDWSDNKFKTASVRAVGLTYKLALYFTI